MLMFECPKCHKCFFMEDAQANPPSGDRWCPNCGLEVPSKVMLSASYLCNYPNREETKGWDVCHLPDKHFKVQVSVTSIPEFHE